MSARLRMLCKLLPAIVLCAAAGVLAVLLAPSAPAQETAPQATSIDFARDIRPIFEINCYKCHDAAKHKGGLRLDSKQTAFIGGDSGDPSIVPKDADHSKLIQLVRGDDPNSVMPPKGDRLTKQQVDLLVRWVKQGAAWPDGIDRPSQALTHWSFNKPARPPMPKVAHPQLVRNPIDAFVLAALEKEGLSLSPEADRNTLVRRLYLDLIGLPPTPAEVEEFVNDSSTDAYEKLADRLQADPHYGERWARPWLDLARYADSSGYGSDPLRFTTWRWRDWVIDALNRNMPYDEFTIEQLAGDLLPHPTTAQLIATAFNRNTMTNTEGGTDPEEFRVAAIKDRVDTTIQVWMGLTMGCAQCHTHKYDPITNREYYQLFAIFNQTADANRSDEEPTIETPTPEEQKKISSLKSQIASAEAKLNAASIGSAELARWEQSLRDEDSRWMPIDSTTATSIAGAKLTKLYDGSLLASGSRPASDTYIVTARAKLKGITAVRVEVLPDPTLPHAGPGRGDDGGFNLSDFRVTFTPDQTAASPGTTPAGATDPRAIAFSSASDSLHTGSASAASMLAKKPSKEGWALRQPGHAESAIFVTSKGFNATDGTLTFTLKQDRRNEPIGRFRLSVTTAPRPARSTPSAVADALAREMDQRTPEQKSSIIEFYRQVSPQLQPLVAEIAKLNKALKDEKIPRTAIMRDLPPDKQREDHILVKGNFLSKGAVVQPAVLAAFNPLPKDAKPNRLGLAEWIVDKNNPLTARVAVNRFWSQLFGIGIVETQEDFGTQGQPPSNQQLLDWLAVEFMNPSCAENHPWDMKRMIKLMVMSATYRQSSRTTPELLAKDPRDRMLSHMPRRRLEAELVRDEALSLSGLISLKIHGPSVYPPQPDGLWQAAFNGQRTYPTSTGPDKYRRGVYVFWRRTVPYPSMSTFDAPSREVCTLRRIQTSTPLQAFVTLNDPVYVECSQALARRIMKEGGQSAEDRARFGLRVCLCRPPEAEQVSRIVELYDRELEHYRNDPDAAEKLIGGTVPAGVDVPDAAAWTVCSNVLLNLDGVLSKR